MADETGYHSSRLEIAESLGEITALHVRLDLGVVKTRVYASSDPGYAAQGMYEHSSALPLVVEYHIKEGVGYLTLRQTAREGDFNFKKSRLDLRLSKEVPLDLVVEVGVGQTDCDLSDLLLRSLRVDGGVGKLEVILPRQGEPEIDIDGGVGKINVMMPPEAPGLHPRRIRVKGGVGELAIALPPHGIYPVDLETGIGKLDVQLPETLSAQIEHRGASFLSKLEVGSKGLTYLGNDRWQTPGYNAESTDRATITVEAGIGSVRVR